MIYTDAHRLFLQILTKNRILHGPEVKVAHERCCKKYNVPSDNLQEFVMDINRQLSLVHLAIRKSFQELPAGDVHCFVLVNLLSGDITRALSTYSAAELALFRRIVEAVVRSENGQIGATQAINLATNLPNVRMKLGDAEGCVDRLVQEKWLFKGERSVSLSALTMSELHMYLEEMYEDNIHKCFFCKILTLKGHQCPTCQVMVHRKCGQNFWSHTNANPPICPDSRCSEPWPHVTLVTDTPRKRSKTDRAYG